MNLLKLIVGSFQLSKTAWIALFLGWAAFWISLTFSFEVPSSGALMICGVVVAEVFYAPQQWVRFVAANPGGYVLRVDGTTSDGVSASHFGVYTTTQLFSKEMGSKSVTSGSGGKLFSQLEIIDNGPLRNGRMMPFKEHKLWSLSAEAERYESTFHRSSAFTAFFGSVLWGYGHLFWT